MGNGGEFGLELERGEAVQGNRLMGQVLDIEGPYLLRFIAVFDAEAYDHRDETVSLAQLSHLQALECGLGNLTDLLVADAKGVGAVLVDVDSEIGHAQAQVVMHLVSAGGAHDFRRPIRKARENVQAAAADADLDGFVHRGTLLQLFDDAPGARHVAVQLGAELDEEPGDVLIGVSIDRGFCAR